MLEAAISDLLQRVGTVEHHEIATIQSRRTRVSSHAAHYGRTPTRVRGQERDRAGGGCYVAADLTTEATHGDGDEMTVCGVDLRPLGAISSETLRRHGPSAAGAGWRDAESQALRFAVLMQAVGLQAGDRVTVNDLGCGYAALYHHLVRSGIGVVEYNGYDISPEMLAAARENVPAAPARFHRSAVLTQSADVSFLSGALNLKVSDDASWKLYARSVVRDLAAHSRRGFAFNLMTTKVTYRVKDLYYADPDEWLGWCRCEISPQLNLFEDYPLYEWTIGGTLEAGA